MTLKSTCEQTFQSALAERRKHPLPSGLYKLEEAYRDLCGIDDEIYRITEVRAKRASRYELQHCTTDDIYVWVRSIPAHIAWVLGYKVLPGLEASTADGADPHNVNQLKSYLRPHVENLLSDLESLRLEMRRSVKPEYDRIDAGESEVQYLVRRAIGLTERALELIPSMSSCA
jgi:hypothetical protein